MKNEKNEQAVSPVIATILMVAITVVLAGVLYVWANNLASEGTDTSASTLNTYTAEDAADDASGAGEGADTLIKMQMTGRDDLAWSFVKISLPGVRRLQGLLNLDLLLFAPIKIRHHAGPNALLRVVVSDLLL